MKHLKIFLSISEFEAAKPSMDTPFVVLEKGTPKVIFSNLPQISEDDLTDGDYVDLGLPSGLKWATCNLGAEKPCDFGDYFMWGSTTPNTNDVCSWANAPFNNGSTSCDKTYFNAHWSEWLDGGVLKLKLEYDAVAAATNGAAHMPTKADWEELKANTTNEWVTCVTALGHKGHTAVNGRLFTSKTDSSKKIFIPASGYRLGSSFGTQGSGASLWSSSLNTSETKYSWGFSFYDSSFSVYSDNRYTGLCVRGVKD